MLPNDEVQVTMTREECARIHAALKALVEIQRAGEAVGMGSALRLTDAADVIEGMLPRLAEYFPGDNEDVYAPEYQEHNASLPPVSEFDVKVSDLRGLSREEASAIFASEYDEAIRALLGTLGNHTDFSQEDFKELLDQLLGLITSVVPVPKDITVGQSESYIRLSDLTTLGGLAYEMYKRQDQIDDKIGKPF